MYKWLLFSHFSWRNKSIRHNKWHRNVCRNYDRHTHNTMASMPTKFSRWIVYYCNGLCPLKCVPFRRPLVPRIQTKLLPIVWFDVAFIVSWSQHKICLIILIWCLTMFNVHGYEARSLETSWNHTISWSDHMSTLSSVDRRLSPVAPSFASNDIAHFQPVDIPRVFMNIEQWTHFIFSVKIIFPNSITSLTRITIIMCEMSINPAIEQPTKSILFKLTFNKDAMSVIRCCRRHTEIIELNRTVANSFIVRETNRTLRMGGTTSVHEWGRKGGDD